MTRTSSPSAKPSERSWVASKHWVFMMLAYSKHTLLYWQAVAPHVLAQRNLITSRAMTRFLRWTFGLTGLLLVGYGLLYWHDNRTVPMPAAGRRRELGAQRA